MPEANLTPQAYADRGRGPAMARGLYDGAQPLMSKIDTVETQALENVVGGADNGYNAGDAVRGGAGALFGGLTGGPIGAVVGFGAGIMSRKVGELGDGVQDLLRERERGQQLDQQRQQRQQRAQPAKP